MGLCYAGAARAVSSHRSHERVSLSRRAVHAASSALALPSSPTNARSARAIAYVGTNCIRLLFLFFLFFLFFVVIHHSLIKIATSAEIVMNEQLYTAHFCL